MTAKQELSCSGAPGCVCRACYPQGWEADDIVSLKAKLADVDARMAAL